MKVVIAGMPQSGQQELFNLLTGVPLEELRRKPLDIQLGVCEVKDPRVVKLKQLYNPKKTTFARIEFLLLPDFNLSGPAKTSILTQMKNADELCFICRSQSEIGSFISELIISDLVTVERRLENIEKEQKKKNLPEREKERQLMLRIKPELENEIPLRQADILEDEKKFLKTFQFLSQKPVILALNVPEDRLGDQAALDAVSAQYSIPAVQISAEIEQEISNLEEPDRRDFMREMGISESALDKMTRLAFAGLGLISFFTVGEDEVRAWAVRKGALAPEAGSVIHSDIEKGFVRAEMFKYDDLISLGSEARVKEQGKFSLKGKDYPVCDGDVLSFRFNV